jgi:phenylalanyl-tRNA synthetase beta subunit
LPSIRSSFRARTRERGYALISAIALAVLYFAVMQLIMIDSSRVLREAQRFRSKIISHALAENAAELAASQMMLTSVRTVDAKDVDGTMKAALNKSAAAFTISAEGTSYGAESRRATVRLQGRVSGTTIQVDYSFHSQ